MYRFFLMALLFVGAGPGRPALAQSASGLPARPVPFTFVTDQGQLLQPAEAKKLDGGLRAYAEKTGTQVVVVTVPSLGGRPVADYARALGTAWGVGQRGKNNGVVLLLSAQEHQVSIQPGAGLASVITPAVTSRVIGKMTPDFKQGNYFGGLRAGLNTLLATANPGSAPGRPPGAAAVTAPNATPQALANDQAAATLTEPAGAGQSETAPVPAGPGFGLGALLIGALVIGGLLWFIIRLFRGRTAAANRGSQPNFYPNGGPQNPNQPTFYPSQNGPASQPNFYPNNQGNASGSSNMGGILATGAAAAAGAYLGNRLSSHGSDSNSSQNFANNNPGTNAGFGGAGGAAGTAAAGDYFTNRSEDAGNMDSAPDYFSGNEDNSSSSGDYFGGDNSSFDDTSSGDTGGGGFDSSDDNSGSW